MVEIPLAEREPRVSGRARDLAVFRRAPRRGKPHDIGARNHDLSRSETRETKRLFEDVPPDPREMPSRVRQGEDGAQLLLRMAALLSAERRQTHDPDDRAGALVREDDEREEDRPQEPHRPAGHQGYGLGLLNPCDARHQFAEDDRKGRDEEKSGNERNHVQGLSEPGRLRHGLDKPRDRGLAQPSDSEVREGDSDLGGGEGPVELPNQRQGGRGATASRAAELLEPRGPDTHEGELRGNEKCVEKEEQSEETEAEPHRHRP